MKILSFCSIVGFIGLLALPVSGADEPTAPSAVFKERGSILGSDLKAIQAALPVFEKHGMKIDGYRVIVLEEKESIIVLFDDPARSPGQFGSTERMLSFEVRLRKSDLGLVDSHFSR